MSELIHICNRCGEIVREETDPTLAKEYPFFCPVCDENKFAINTTEAEVVYVATVTISHTDAYEQDNDGTATLGVFSSMDGAMKRITEEYNRDKDDLLAGSCKRCATNLRKINEDESYEPRRDEDHGFGEAWLAIDFDKARDCDICYSVNRFIVND